MMTQKGFSLLEVLVAMLILSVGLIGLINTQLISLHRSSSVYYKTIAGIQAYSFLEVLRAHFSAVNREAEYQIWNDENSHLLPHGKGFYHCENEMCTVKINWQEQTIQMLTLSSQI